MGLVCMGKAYVYELGVVGFSGLCGDCGGCRGLLVVVGVSMRCEISGDCVGLCRVSVVMLVGVVSCWGCVELV